jgi:hypothetical protein
MAMRRKIRTSLLLVALCAGTVAGVQAPGGAIPLLKYKCVGTITYRGHAFPWYSTHLWRWSMTSSGTCVTGMLQKVTYSTKGFSMPACGGPYYATSSPNEPGSVYLATTSITTPGYGAQYDQQWVGLAPLTINRWEPVPSRYIPIGGTVGYGYGIRTMQGGTWGSPIIKVKVAFLFSGEEIPNTDQPDGGAC